MMWVVASMVGFEAALAAAGAGDRIEFAAGAYGRLEFAAGDGAGGAAAPVVVASRDPDTPAIFSGLSVKGVEGLRLERLVFDYDFASGDEPWTPLARIDASSDIAVSAVRFEGDVASGVSEAADGLGYGRALSIKDSRDIVIRGSEIKTFWKAIGVGGNDRLEITENEIWDIRSDGINISGTQEALVVDNYLHDFRTSPESGDHADMLQLWTQGTDRPSTDITVRDNVFDIGEGGITQTIFMGNELARKDGAGEEVFYRDILIEGNEIYGAHTHGISVGEAIGVTVRNNAVLEAGSEGDVRPPAIRMSPASRKVVVKDNIASNLALGDGARSGWAVSGNVHVQTADPAAPDYYTDLFVDSSLGVGPRGRAYAVDPEAVPASVGPASMRSRGQDGEFFDISVTPDGTRMVFAVHPGSVIDAEDEVLWRFGDGVTASGKTVHRAMPGPGVYEAALEIREDGTVVGGSQVSFGVPGNDVIDFDPDAGAFFAREYGIRRELEGDMPRTALADGGWAVRMGPNPGARVSEAYLERFFGADTFELSVAFQSRAPGEGWGEIARIHTHLRFGVDKSGDFYARLKTDDGTTTSLEAPGISLLDGGAHTAQLRLDGKTDALVVRVDDRMPVSAVVTGQIKDSGKRDLAFGLDWSKTFEGRVLDFDLDAGGERVAVPAPDVPGDGG